MPHPLPVDPLPVALTLTYSDGTTVPYPPPRAIIPVPNDAPAPIRIESPEALPDLDAPIFGMSFLDP